MITSWDIYWITRLDGIVILLSIGACFLVVAACICLPFGDSRQDDICYYKRAIISFLAGAFFFTLSAVFLPSTKDAVAIYMIPKIVNNEQIKQLPDNAMKFLNEKFEEWIDDMVKKEKK